MLSEIGSIVFGPRLTEEDVQQQREQQQRLVNSQHQQVLVDLIERVKALEEQVRKLSE